MLGTVTVTTKPGTPALTPKVGDGGLGPKGTNVDLTLNDGDLFVVHGVGHADQVRGDQDRHHKHWEQDAGGVTENVGREITGTQNDQPSNPTSAQQHGEILAAGAGVNTGARRLRSGVGHVWHTFLLRGRTTDGGRDYHHSGPSRSASARTCDQVVVELLA